MKARLHELRRVRVEWVIAMALLLVILTTSCS